MAMYTAQYTPLAVTWSWTFLCRLCTRRADLPSLAPQRTHEVHGTFALRACYRQVQRLRHQDSGRLGRCAAVLGYVSCELLSLPRYNEDISWARGFTNCTRTTVYEKGEPLTQDSLG